MASLFVYGSLQPGGPNADVLSPISGTWQKATVSGRLIKAGWGTALGYPGLRLVEDGEDIKGSVLTSADLDTFWDELDAFEGAQYERVLTSVTLESGENLAAFLYALR